MLTQQYLEERSMSMNTFLATTSQGLARASQSASGEWSVEFLLSEQDVRCLAADPLNSRVIYAGTQGQGVLRSEDGGKTWRSVGLAGHIVKALAASRTQPGTVYAGTKPALLFVSRDGGGSGAGVSVSRDAGAAWTQSREGLDRHYGWAVAADPDHPEVWYASLAPSALKAHSEQNAQAAIVRSVGGASWQTLTGGLPQPLNHMPYALLTDPAAPGHVYAGLSNGEVWHSADHGDTWHKLPFCLKGIHRTLILLP